MTDPTDSLVAIAVDQEELHGSRVVVGIGFSPAAVRTARRGPAWRAGRGGFTSMVLGSVSMQCAQHASCPVTVVHSPEAHHQRLHPRRSRQADPVA
jgi:nucleotide-binding universal stress UspA family protein